MVISKPSSPTYRSQAVVYDFQPKDPENIYTALVVLSDRPKPGSVLVRKLTKLLKSRCWKVGSSKVDTISVATEFNSRWHTDLRVGYHDCCGYTNGLVELLIGEKGELDRLRRNAGDQIKA